MQNSTTPNEVFGKLLNDLNPKQREAVEAIDGPVLVVAGPGTGKTQILAARIGNILQKTDAEPHNILCLTFTDAGTVAMRKRLLEFIGPAAHNVNIYTFHGFCNSVIQENQHLFGTRELQALSDLEEVDLINRLIDGFDIDNPLFNIKSPYHYFYSIKDVFKVMNDENWSAEYIKNGIKTYLDDLPLRDEYIYKRNGKGFKKGEVKSKDIAKEEAAMAKLSAAVDLYDKYQKIKAEEGRYDYADMILWVLKAFKENEDLLLTYQEKYLYTLVDEYQDTNGSQNEIIQLLTSYWDVPNVFVVGDDDQSIYRFQGANVANITEFAVKHKENLKVIMLENNYRSTQHVLDISGHLIENNNERLINESFLKGISKSLTASHPAYMNSVVTPVVQTYQNQKQVIIDLGRRIEQMHNEGVDLSEVAVIYRKHKFVDDLIKYFEHKGIPYSTKRSQNALEVPLVKQLILILEYIALETKTPFSGEHLLYKILHFSFLKIPAIEVARLWMGRRDLRAKKRNVNLREIIVHPVKYLDEDTLGRMDEDVVKSVKIFSKHLEEWISERHNMTLLHLLEEIIKQCGVLPHVLNSKDKLWNLQVLRTFFDFVKDEGNRKPHMETEDLLDLIGKFESNNIRLPVTKLIENVRGVNLMTAHGSKGLEFETVFVLGCAKKMWEKTSGMSAQIRFPDTLLYGVDGDEAEEERRLLFVAMTRAKRHLYMLEPLADEKGKDMDKSSLITDIETSPIFKRDKMTVEEEEFTDFEMALFEPSREIEISLFDKQLLAGYLNNYTLNVTHLNNFLECPLRFFFQNLLRVPAGKNDALAFGTATHEAMDYLFKEMSAHPEKEFPNVGSFLSVFERALTKNRDCYTQEKFEQRIVVGRQIMEEYYNEYINSWIKEVRTEEKIQNTHIAGVPVTGSIDKIEFIDKRECIVVDYKTGNHKAFRLKGPTEKDPLGGSYWRQAVFYKLLIQNYPMQDWNVQSVYFDYLQKQGTKPDVKYVTPKVKIEPGDTDIVREQIKESYEKILNMEFTKGCGEETCEWCNMVEENNIS